MEMKEESSLSLDDINVK
jgi:hypothetical protein